ncbi:MAG TPA: endonuclease/exonuclease/phosphatase family protein [Burkholderiaceae bacterium]|nr:endonuclease/exonuclease/phosphatase family protein [Burkholderiaceae bacterium]
MLSALALVIGGIAIVATLLSVSRSKVWWVRVWDFPRLQLCVLAFAALVLWIFGTSWLGWPHNLFTLALAAVLLSQGARIWRYTPLAPREVQQSDSTDISQQLSLVVSNVLQTNRQADLLLSVIRGADPDVVLFCETDEWWVSRLDALAVSHPYAVKHPLSNTYGLLLRSRLDVRDWVIDFLDHPDMPSIQAKVVLRNGVPVWLTCVHPPPPVPGESAESAERDSALLQVARRVSEATGPVVVCGDLNDVAWSRSTRLFQKVSGLLEPRKGRGFFSTFHARYPGFRVPIDHVFHSKHFRLVSMRRLGYVGSDHFPMHITLSCEPDAISEQEGPRADTADRAEARQAATVAQAKNI